MSDKCKDYGGETSEGMPCQRPAGWGLDGVNSGPCEDHKNGQKWVEEAESCSPISIIKRIQSGVLDPNALTPGQRRACLPILCIDKGKTYEEAAEIFDVSLGTIGRDWDLIRSGLEDKVLQVSSSDLAAEVFQSMKRDAAKLRKQGKYEAANRVISRAIEDLQDLGLIDKQADKMQLNWVDELEDI